MARSTSQAAQSASCSSTASSKSSPITKLISFLCHATLPFASCMPGLSPTKRSSREESRKERRPHGVPDIQVMEGPSTDVWDFSTNTGFPQPQIPCSSSTASSASSSPHAKGSPALTTNAAELHASNAWLDDCNLEYPTDLLKPSVSVLSIQSSDLDDASDQTKAVRPSVDAALPIRSHHMDDQVRAANVVSSDLSEPNHPKTTATQQSSPVGVNKPPRHPFARVTTTNISKTASKTTYDLKVASGSADVSILAVDQAYVDFQKCVLGTLMIDLF
eukprot:gene455-1857_t